MEDTVITRLGVSEALCHAVQTVCAHRVAEIAPGLPEPPTIRWAEEEEGDAHLPTDRDAAIPEPTFQIVVGKRLHDGIEVADDTHAKREFRPDLRMLSLSMGLLVHAADALYGDERGMGHLGGV